MDEFLDHLASLGLSPSSVEEHDGFYLVDGDMMFSKTPAATQLRQLRVDRLVSYAEVADITVTVDGSIPTSGVDAWRNEIQQAINDWNTVGGSRVHFSYTLDPSADVVVQSDAGILESNMLAAASFPSSTSGRPGSLLVINLDANGNQTISSGQKRQAMAHELGHIIGLYHTNESIGVRIPGTPCMDSASVMTGGTAGRSWAGFSFYDREAVRAMYPIDRPAGVLPFLRYYNQTTGDHFYTTFFGELGCGLGGYVAEGTTGYIFQAQAPGTSPVYRYWSHTFGDHFYTLTSGSYDTYVSEGIAGYVFTAQTPDNIPIFHYYHAGLHDNLYTQYGTSASGYVLQGVPWYAVP
jgi:hypothetical protein